MAADRVTEPQPGEQVWTVLVCDDQGQPLYRRRELGYSPTGVMTQITERDSSRQDPPEEPWAAEPDPGTPRPWMPPDLAVVRLDDLQAVTRLAARYLRQYGYQDAQAAMIGRVRTAAAMVHT